jgi:hypothetical protein
MSLLDQPHQDLKRPETALGNHPQHQRFGEREPQAQTDCSRIAEICSAWSRATLASNKCGCRKEIEEPFLSWTLPILSRQGSLTLDDYIRAWQQPDV